MKDIKKGDLTIEARAVSGDQHSLEHQEVVVIEETPEGDVLGGIWLPGIAAVILVVGVAVYIFLKRSGKNKAGNVT